jgi:glucose-6-phosphate dehydrogenase assembly protein OpcA
MATGRNGNAPSGGRSADLPGTRQVQGGPIAIEGAGRPGEPSLRWKSRARSIEQIEQELVRIWAQPNLTAVVEGAPGRHIAARTSVMNLVVVARRPETAQRAAATIQMLTGRHPSRTIIVSPADPDGPSWIDAQIEAHCMLPRDSAPEVCAETIFMTVGGDAGRHAAAVVAPLLVHDLPVTLWWPGNPPFRWGITDLLDLADRLVVDGSSWSENGLDRLRYLAGIASLDRIAIFDFALVRQSRWREAIASVFDHPELLAYLRHLRRVAVTYASHDQADEPLGTNVVKPVYHVAWLASRLDLGVRKALEPEPTARRAPSGRAARGLATRRGWTASLGDGRAGTGVVIRPIGSSMPGGTTLRLELLAERRGSELRVDVTAEAEIVRARVWRDGVEALDRHFQAPRRTDLNLLAEAIEAGGRDPVAQATIRCAGELAGGPIAPPLESHDAGYHGRSESQRADPRHNDGSGVASPPP